MRGALKNLGYAVGRNTIKRILKEQGIEPAPLRRRQYSWGTFVKAQLSAIATGKRYLILDRDPLYTRKLRATMKEGPGGAPRSPPSSPNLNAYAERFLLSIRSECLDRIVPLGEATSDTNGRVERRERLGGLLNFYRRAA